MANAKKKSNDFISQILAIKLRDTLKSDYTPGLVGKNERVVGTMSDNLTRVHIFYLRHIDNLESKKIELDKIAKEHALIHLRHGVLPHDEKACKEFRDKAEKLIKEVESMEQRYRNLNDILFGMIQEEFPELLGKESIGIREGGQIVLTEQQEPKNFEEFFRGVSGERGPISSLEDILNELLGR